MPASATRHRAGASPVGWSPRSCAMAAISLSSWRRSPSQDLCLLRSCASLTDCGQRLCRHDGALSSSIQVARGQVCAAQARVRPQRVKRPLDRVSHRHISPIKGGVRSTIPISGPICAGTPLVLPSSAAGGSHLGNPGVVLPLSATGRGHRGNPG